MSKTIFEGKSLKAKILKDMVIVASIPLIFAAAFIYFNLTQNLVKEYRSSISANIDKCAQLINSEFMMYFQKSNSIIENQYLMKSLQTDYEEDIEKMMVFFTNLNSLISEPFGNSNKGYFAVYPFNETIYEGSYIERFERIKYENLIQDIVKNKNPNIVWGQKLYTKEYGNNVRYIKFYRNIIDLKTPVGLLEGNIPYGRIEYFMESTGLPDKGLIFSTNSQGEVMYFKNKSDLKIKSVDEIHERDFLCVTRELSNGYKITAAIPRSIIYRKNLSIFLALFAVLSLIFIVMFLASKFSTQRITARLETFINRIKNDDTVLLNEELIQVSGDNEVAIIKQRFKELICRINELHAETTMVKLQKSSFELELLQSRINPHLLYNSLSVIKWNAQWNKDPKTVELIDSMVKYYRAALNKGNNIIKIWDELEMIKEYVRINEFSYSCEYKLKIDLEEKIKDYYTIKHLLQPIVENAILHGLNGVEDGQITIKGCMEGDDIIISIEDNGNGMDESKVHQILCMNYNTSYGGYGIKNLIKRINMYYGENYGLKIESQIGEGARVIVRIKALGEKELIERFNTI